jgi:hypothetical protein
MSRGSRTPFQEAAYRKRLEIARRGGYPLGVADFQGISAPFLKFGVYDADIAELLEACAEGGIEIILMGGGAACIGSSSLRQLLKAFKTGPLWHIDLSGCDSVQNVLGELIKGVPFDRGCSIEASGCGIPESEVGRLRNMTQQAEEARSRAKKIREQSSVSIAKHSQCEEALEDFALENRVQDNPPSAIIPLYHPLQWREGIEARAVATHKEFVKTNPNGVYEDGVERSLSFIGPSNTKITLSKEECNVLDIHRRRMLEEVGYLANHQHGVGRPMPAAFERAFAPVLESM